MVLSALRLEDREVERPARTQPATVDRSLERLGWLMDDLFRIPVLGWRFGLDAIIGLVPALGDTTTSLVSLYILASAVRYRVPKITLLRMGVNIAIDYVMGSVPVVGDLFDAYWKSNKMNVELLKRRAPGSAIEAEKGRASDWLFVGLIILVLVGLLLGSAIVSIYLGVKLIRLMTGATS
ncbi:MAG TPA: DUF4112 domain-containing protein [Pyrinomonadaceae bacterium]|jgi:hypothetical protein